jgi:hypothetical protein
MASGQSGQADATGIRVNGNGHLRYSAAYHEAGHAIVGWSLGLTHIFSASQNSSMESDF